MGRAALFGGLAGALLLALLVFVSARLLLPACGLAAFLPGSWLNHCAAEADPGDAEALARLEEERHRLERRIADLRQDIALARCEPEPPPPPPVQAEETPPPEPEPEPEVAEGPPRIDEDAWERQDQAALEGCWQLDSEYVVTDIRTRERISFNRWQICLDDQGRGRQVLRAENGATCEGDVTADFDGQGRLVFTDTDNVQCSTGFYIYRRITRCSLRGDGTADCRSFQPETNSRGQARLRRG